MAIGDGQEKVMKYHLSSLPMAPTSTVGIIVSSVKPLVPLQ